MVAAARRPTQASETAATVYVAGSMTRRPHCNAGVFFSAREALRGLGYRVHLPAIIQRPEFTASLKPTASLHNGIDGIGGDIKRLLASDLVAVLPETPEDVFELTLADIYGIPAYPLCIVPAAGSVVRRSPCSH